MAQDLAPTPASPLGRAERSYRLRFGLAYVALALVAAAALAATYVLAEEPRRASVANGSGWSEWRPAGEDISTYPNQIAERIAPRYKLPSGRQLTGVVAGPPVIQDVPVRAVAIQPDGRTVGEELQVIPTDRAVMYTLCGLGDGCTIEDGEPSEARERLLRRQVLELALYTFKYLDVVDSVLALLPPEEPDASGSAVFLREDDVARELQRPLAETLAARVPPPEALADGPERAVVDKLTRQRVFSWEPQQLQDGSAAIVLTPLGAVPTP